MVSGEGPRLEPGPDGGLDGERVVAGSATVPGWAQAKQATWHLLPFHPVVPSSAGGPAGVGWAAT